MKINYIHHSGFLIETSSACYVFDYFKGKLPPFDTSKPVTVFSSHGHNDHYNPEIFTLLREAGAKNICACLSKDIDPKRFPSEVTVTKIYGDKEYVLPGGEKLVTFFSTDVGVAFYLETAEGNIFHAGDLNDWRWEGEEESSNRQMVGSYRHEIDKLKAYHIDHAFVPLDPRQEKYTGEGLLYFLQTIDADNVYPMHWWGRSRVIDEFINKHPQYADVVKHTEKV
ncbi:MAG: MBL fold metallo-hydrolase [Clostridia bacterium]|nr:MBL fold metallo-hydrolase [Clostridia bacterium]